MVTLLHVIHVLDAVVLVIVVLLQQGKGGGMGLAFGGSSQTVFGGAGAGSILTKITTWAAVIFMVTSLSLAYLSGRSGTSLMRGAGATPGVEDQAVPGGEIGEPVEQAEEGASAPSAVTE